MPEKAVDDVMEAAVGAHFSGLRLEALRLSSPSSPSSPSSARASPAAATHSNGAVYANGTAAAAAVELASPPAARQPFVIGMSLFWSPHPFPLRARFSHASGPLLILAVLFEIFSLDFFLSQGVSGGTASGKTTVCDMIIQQLHDHRVVLVNQVCVITAASAAGFVLVGETRLLLLLCLVEFCFAVYWFCLVCPKPCSLSSLKGGIIP
jgi:uridine kinase